MRPELPKNIHFHGVPICLKGKQSSEISRGFVFNEISHQNATKFSIFHVIRKSMHVFEFFISSKFTFPLYECPRVVR